MKRKKNTKSLGFTLIELLVVIGLLAILLSIVIIAINPFEQYAKADDLKRRIATQDLVNTSNIYLTEKKAYPWEVNEACKVEIEEGGFFTNMGECIKEITGRDKLSKNEKDNLEKTQVHTCREQAVMCYLPSTKEIIPDAIYDKYGVVNPGCPGNKKATDCYWCKRVKTEEECVGGPEPTPTLTPTPTPQNKWGKAVSMNGYTPGQDPNYPKTAIPNREVIHRNFTAGMEINSPSLTIEAWIKPSLPIPTYPDNKIVQSIFQLTQIARMENGNIFYEYYFDVRQVENGCGRTVVYSGGSLVGGRKLGYHLQASPEEFQTWKHVAGVLDKDTLKIYENGKFLNSYQVTNTGTFTVCNDYQNDFNIGAQLLTPTLYIMYFQGQIDELRVSTTVRYSSNFIPQKEPFTPDSHTKYLFHFDGNTNDSSGNNLNANIIEGVQYVDSDIPF